MACEQIFIFAILKTMSNEIVSPVIKKFLLSHGYSENFELTSIAGAGSGRQYYRISDGKRSCVLQVCAEVNDDFKHFVEFSKTFRDFGLPVTRIYHVDEASTRNSGFAALTLPPSSGKRTTLPKIT